MNMKQAIGVALHVLGGLLALSAPVNADSPTQLPNMLPFPNPTGFAATYNTTGPIDFPFFQSLGTNGRACVSCRQPPGSVTVRTATLLTG
jgi:hypothetical protein